MLSYAPTVAPVIAIINAVIAVYVAQFKPEQVRAKKILLAVAIALGVLSAGATIWAQHDILSQQQAERDRRASIRARLATYITGANNLLPRLLDKTNDKSIVFADSDRWNYDVIVYLNEIGGDYVARFTDYSGLSPVTPTGDLDEDRRNYWIGVYRRDTRLVQFAAEFAR